MDIKVLNEIGFSNNESKVYLDLLNYGPCLVSATANRTNINRSLTYRVLESLIKQGLATYVIKNRRKFFKASPPQKIINILDDKKKNFLDFLPNLKQHISMVKQKVEIYEGEEGIKTIYKDILTHKQLLAFGVTGYAYKIMEYSFPQFIKQFMKRGNAKFIANEEVKNSELSKIKKIKLKYSRVYSPATTAIYGDKVAIQLLNANPPFIILIENKEISEGYRNYFNLLWKLTK